MSRAGDKGGVDLQLADRCHVLGRIAVNQFDLDVFILTAVGREEITQEARRERGEYPDLDTPVFNAADRGDDLGASIDLLQALSNTNVELLAREREEYTAVMSLGGILRTGQHDGKLYLDLADDTWRAVEIDRHGSRTVTRPPVNFRRQRGMLPLPAPEGGGKISDLRPFLNVSDEDDFVLVVAWLLAALRPVGPYPLLVLAGEPGSAKSTAARILRGLIDPNVSALRSSPREERDCWIAASNAGVLAFDNLSSIPTWLSDALCRVASGGGFATRQLHTDDDEILFEAVCPVILTAVGDVIVQSDLADRSIMIELPAIPDSERRNEDGMRRAFHEARPKILGALLDAVAHGLATEHEVVLERLPRLADFAVWAAACETAFVPAGTIMAAFQRNTNEAVASVLESDAVCVAMLAFLDANQGQWKGKPQKLLADIRPWAPEGALRERNWPRNPQTLSNRLRLATPTLRQHGVQIIKGKTNGERFIQLIRD